MTATYLGGGSVGSFMPTSLAALAAAEVAIALPAIELQAQLTGALEASLSVGIEPPSIDLAAALAAAIQLPGISIDVNVMASLAAELNLKIGDLQLALSLLLALKLAFGTVGVHAYKIQGPIGSMGSDLGGQLSDGMPDGSGPAQLGTAIVLLAGDNGAIAALESLFSAA